MENEEKKGGLVGLVVVLSILLILTAGYIVYDKVFKAPKTDNNTTNNGSGTVEQTTKLTEAEIKSIYYGWYGAGEDVKIITIGLKLEGSEEVKNSLFTDKQVLISSIYNSDEAKLDAAVSRAYNARMVAEQSIKVAIADVKKAYETLFGVFPTAKDFKYSEVGECKVSGEYYICDTTKANPSPDTGRPEKEIYTKYYKSEESGNDLYVYVKAVFTSFIYKDDTSKAETHYYSDYTFKTEIPELKGKSEDDFVSSTYDSYMKTYKYTFNKASNVKYYLHSV